MTKETRSPSHPGQLLRLLLERKGWSQQELAEITGTSRQTINALVAGRSRLTTGMAVSLSAAFGNEPTDWTSWSVQHELSLARTDTRSIERWARMFEIAPVTEMRRRRWIGNRADADAVESELENFFGSSLDEPIAFPIAGRGVPLSGLNKSEQAWCFRARQMASSLQVGEFLEYRLEPVERRLRHLAAFPKQAAKLSELLSNAGVRFVVVEPLANCRIDGAAFWIEGSPAIAISLRHDRIDAFWFTVMHEWFHIRNRDAYSADVNLIAEAAGGNGLAISVSDDLAEQKANEQAANLLVPDDEIVSFIRRLAPIFPRDRVVQFANKVKMHPGVVVGQLQHQGAIGYNALREFLVKIRSTVTSTALTDGWGETLSPGVV